MGLANVFAAVEVVFAALMLRSGGLVDVRSHPVQQEILQSKTAHISWKASG